MKEQFVTITLHFRLRSHPRWEVHVGEEGAQPSTVHVKIEPHLSRTKAFYSRRNCTAVAQKKWQVFWTPSARSRAQLGRSMDWWNHNVDVMWKESSWKVPNLKTSSGCTEIEDGFQVFGANFLHAAPLECTTKLTWHSIFPRAASKYN